MRYSRNCSEISVFSFYQVLEANDFRYIVMGWDGYEQLPKEFSEDTAKEHWAVIYEEYCKLSSDTKSLMYFAIACELLYLETRFEVAHRLIKQLILRKDVPEAVVLYIDALRTCNYKINPKVDLDEEIERIVVQLKQSQNKINLKKNELETFKPEEGDSEPMSLTEQMVKLEQALGRNEINPKKTSIEKFVAMIKEVKEINEHKAKMNKKQMA